jgi:hypothetical protein
MMMSSFRAPLAFRLDTWVLIVSIGIVVVSIVSLLLLHLGGRLLGKLTRKRQAVRESPEPPARIPAPAGSAGAVQAATHPIDDDPERLQRACAELEESLAALYLQLAEAYLRKGEVQQAATYLQRILQVCAQTRHVEAAQERLRQIHQRSNP